MARIGGQIFQQQLLGDIEIAQLLRQAAQVARHVGLVRQQRQCGFVCRQGLGQVAGLFATDGQDMPGQPAGLVQLQSGQGAPGPTVEILHADTGQGGLQLVDDLALFFQRGTAHGVRQAPDRLG